jgi:hypothetical protein
MKYTSDQFYDFANPNFSNSMLLVLIDPITNKTILSSTISNFTFPGLSVSPIELPVGQQNHLSLPDNVVNIDDINISFVLSNSFKNYFILRRWLLKSAADPLGYLADIVILLVDNNNQVEVNTIFTKVFPTNVSQLVFDYTQNEATQKTFDSTFKTNGTIENIELESLE